MMHLSYHETYLNAEERCNEHEAYLADVLDQAENDFIKSVLRAVNPKDGTDYWWVISKILQFLCFIKSLKAWSDGHGQKQEHAVAVWQAYDFHQVS